MKPSEILKKYGRELEPEWTGYKPVWHAWHEPDMVWFMTYQDYLKRIVQIEKKPENEKTIRFLFFKPVAGQFVKTKADEEMIKAEEKRRKAEQERRNAHEEFLKAAKKWRKAYEKRQKVYEEWLKANEEWQNANEELLKAEEEWRTADASSIEKLHAKECKGVVWENNQMKF